MFRRNLYSLMIAALVTIAILIPGVEADETAPTTDLSDDKINTYFPKGTPTPMATTPVTSPDKLIPSTGSSTISSILFPAAILDDFNRTNGPVGSNWSGNTSGYTVVANHLDVGNGQDIYWNAGAFGSEQEVYVTLTTVDANAEEIGLILKSQSPTGLSAGSLQVVFSPAQDNVQVWTYTSVMGWQKQGASIPITFVDGDQFGAQADAYGQVGIYKNGVLLAIRNVSAWPHHAAGGYIGLFNLAANNLVLDDFGGGNSAVSLPTPTPTPIPCTDPLTCNPITSVPSFWRCNIDECLGSDWLGSVINWWPAAAYESNNRTLNNSRTVYAIADDQILYPYMKEWADGCEVTVVSGTVLIIEWQRGADEWRQTQLEPGDTYTIQLVSPEDGAMIEGLDGDVNPFSVSLNNCTPGPTAIQLSNLSANQVSSLTAFPLVVGFFLVSGSLITLAVRKKKG